MCYKIACWTLHAIMTSAKKRVFVKKDRKAQSLSYSSFIYFLILLWNYMHPGDRTRNQAYEADLLTIQARALHVFIFVFEPNK